MKARELRSSYLNITNIFLKHPLRIFIISFFVKKLFFFFLIHDGIISSLRMTEKVRYEIGWSSFTLFCGSEASLADPMGRIVKPSSVSS